MPDKPKTLAERLAQNKEKTVKTGKPKFNFKSNDKGLEVTKKTAPPPKPKETITAPTSGDASSIMELAKTNLDLEAQQQPKQTLEPGSLTMKTGDYETAGQPDSFTQSQMEKIKNTLAILENNIEDKTIVGDAVRNVLRTTHANPELAELLLPEEIGLLSRGVQKSYGIVLVEKQTRSAKKTAKSERVDKIAGNIADMGLKF